MPRPTKLLITTLFTSLLAMSTTSFSAPIGDPEGKHSPIPTVPTEKPAAIVSAPIVATVNGVNITEWTLKRYTHQRGLPPEAATGVQRKALIEELINRELIYQNGVNLGVDKTPAIKKEIEYQRVNVIAGVMLNRSSDRFAVDDAEMKKEYESRLNELGGTEYKARHILVAHEREAWDIIDELDEDGDFEELAKEYSTGPSAATGGELGWFRAEEMMKPFGEAIQNMDIETYSQAPVKTDFGWHIIELENKRAIKPPPFESIKEQIRVGMQSRLMEKYIADLRKAAKIKKP